MRENKLHTVSTHTLTIPVSVWVSIIVAAVTFWSEPLRQLALPEGIFHLPPESFISTPALIIINQVVIWFTGALLLQLNEQFTIIHSRTSLPFLFFVLLGNIGLHSSYYNSTDILGILYIFALFILFSSYQKTNSQPWAFAISLVVGTGTLLNGNYLCFLPLFWTGLFLMKSLSFKSFLATLLGVITPVWMVYCFNLVLGNPLNYSQIVEQIISFSLLSPQLLFTVPYLPLTITLFLGLFTSLLNIRYLNLESLKVRALNTFITRTTLSVILLIFIKSDQLHLFTVILNMCVAMQASYFFSKSRMGIVVLLFYIFLLSYLTIYIWNLLQASVNGDILVSF